MQKVNKKSLKLKRMNQKNLIKVLVVGFIIAIAFIIYSGRSHTSEIKDIYKKIEASKRLDIVKDSLITDSLIKIREKKLILIDKKIEVLNKRQEDAEKKINKKYETKVNYIYSSSSDTNRSLFQRNFSKKVN